MRNEIYAADMHFLLSGLPNPTARGDRRAALSLGLAGESGGSRRTHPSRPSALGIQGLTHGPRVCVLPVLPVVLGQQVWREQRALVQTRLFARRFLWKDFSTNTEASSSRSVCSRLWAQRSPPWHAIPRGPDQPLCCGLTTFMVRFPWAAEAEPTHCVGRAGRGGESRRLG